MDCTKLNCPMQAGTVTENCGENCPWRTIAKTGDMISRAAVLRMLDENGVVFRGEIEKMPAVDAEPVVRCRDCKYYNITGCSAGFGWCEDTVVNKGVWDNFYCADGERRESE